MRKTDLELRVPLGYEYTAQHGAGSVILALSLLGAMGYWLNRPVSEGQPRNPRLAKRRLFWPFYSLTTTNLEQHY